MLSSMENKQNKHGSASTRTSSTLFLYTPIYVLMHLPRTISVLNLLSTRIPSKFLQLQETSLSISFSVCVFLSLDVVGGEE